MESPHAYLGRQSDLPALASSFPAGTYPLLPCEALVFPGERAALAVPSPLLQRATTLCLLARGAPAATATLIQVTSARAEDCGRAVQLCACTGLGRVRVLGVARGAGGLLLARTQALDTLGAEEGAGAAALPPREALAGAAHLPARLWRAVHAARLAEAVRAQWRGAGLRALPLPAACPPPVLAWGVLRCLPVDEGVRREVFYTSASVCCVLRREAALLRALALQPPPPLQPPLLQQQPLPLLRMARLSCRHCGVVVARESVAALASPLGGAGGGAASELGGGSQGSHVFVNPAGASFRIFTVPRVAAGAVSVHGPPTLQHTWFPGMAWEGCVCCCGEHLGWRYSSSERSFFGLSVEEVSIDLEAAAASKQQ
jgi:hypothetical protein